MNSQTIRLVVILVLLMLITVTGAAAARPVEDAADDRVAVAITELEKLINTEMAASGVPGIAVAVVHRDKVIYLKGFGVREIGKSDPIDADTVFQLASVSKSIASTVVAGLVGDKVITWDDRVIDHLPGFQMSDAFVTRHVTLRDLFSHRSGLPEHAGDLIEDLDFDRATVLHRLRFIKPASSFRSAYAYTNFGLTVAGEAASRAAGKSWEDVAASRLFRPLGMHSTSYRHADYAARTNRALIHAKVNGQWAAAYVRNADPEAPAGGASSNVRDLAQWVRLQLADGKLDGKPIIDAQALAQTHRPHIVSSPLPDPTRRAGFYGLGWNVSYDNHGRLHVSHSGAFALGAATNVSLVPAAQLGIVVLSNAMPIGLVESLGRSFTDLAVDGAVERDWMAAYAPFFANFIVEGAGYDTDYSKPPTPAGPALDNTAYTGTYHNDLFGDLEIVAEGGKLVMRLGAKKSAFELTHYDRDLFIFQPTGENAAGLAGVTFQVGSDRIATSVALENLTAKGSGTFTRVSPKP